jgi:hypothetical protein
VQYGSFAYGAVEIAGQQTPIVVPTPPAAKRFTLFIAGIDRTSLMLASTLNGTNPLSQVSTCQFALRDSAGTFHPTIGQDIQVFSNTTKIFGGTIDESVETAYQARKDVRADVKCSDYSAILDRRIVGGFYTSFSMSSIVSDIVQKFLSADGIIYNATDGDPGTTLGDMLFNWVTARQAFNQLSAATGWDFNVDYNKVLRFFPKASALGAAPFNLADNDGNVLAVGESGGTTESALIRVYRGTYRNRQYVRSSSQPLAQWGDTFSAAIPGPYASNKQAPGGGRIFFVTLFKIEATPTVLKNGSAQRVIPLSQVAGAAPGSYDFYWIPDGSGVVAAVAPVSTDIIIVNYQSRLSPVTVVVCAAEVAARGSAEGNSGYYDDVQDAANVTDPGAITNYATALLNRYGCTNGIPSQVMYATIKDGLFAGMLQTINLTQPLIASATYLISGVTWKDVDKDHIEYQVTCDIGQYLGDNYQQYFAALVNRGQMPQPSNRQTYLWQLFQSVPGLANPGFQGGLYNVVQIVQNQVEILQYISVSIAGANAPSHAIQIQLIINTNGNISVTFQPGVSGELRAYARTDGTTGQFKVFAGDILQIQGSSGSPDANFKDINVTLVTSVSAA